MSHFWSGFEKAAEDKGGPGMKALSAGKGALLGMAAGGLTGHYGMRATLGKHLGPKGLKKMHSAGNKGAVIGALLGGAASLAKKKD